jgi:hypothetical protein
MQQHQWEKDAAASIVGLEPIQKLRITRLEHCTSVLEYLGLKYYWRECHMAHGGEIDDAEFIETILYGLSKEYRDIQKSYSTAENAGATQAVSLYELTKQLRDFERSLKRKRRRTIQPPGWSLNWVFAAHWAYIAMFLQLDLIPVIIDEFEFYHILFNSVSIAVSLLGIVFIYRHHRRIIFEIIGTCAILIAVPMILEPFGSMSLSLLLPMTNVVLHVLVIVSLRD